MNKTIMQIWIMEFTITLTMKKRINKITVRVAVKVLLKIR